MSTAALYKASGRYCGANWSSDQANKLSTTDHGTCRAACEAQNTCLAVSVSTSGCVKCTKDSIDWASGELHSSSAWTTYTKAPITCVSPKTYDIAWRNTEAWCMANAPNAPAPGVTSTERKQHTLTDWDLTAGTKEFSNTYAGYLHVTAASAAICGCRSSTIRIRHSGAQYGLAGGSGSCNHMWGNNGYCPHNLPFETGSIITGCNAGSLGWSTNCYTKPQLTGWFS